MACEDGCNCVVRAGQGLVVTGSGSARDPYRVSIDGTLTGNLRVEDSDSVNLQLTGSGSPIDPYVLSAAATLKLTQLADVNDPQGGPNVGDVPVWVVTGATPHWEFQPPPPNPAGSVNTGTGLAGDGSLGAPLTVKLVGTTAGGPATGLEVYADVAGNLRAVPPAAATVSWDSISGRPSSFPTTPADFTGTLPVNKGGTGQTNLANVTVGNSTKVDGHRIFVQSGTPSGAVLNDLWLY